ncbi:hypothetical protein [Nocardia sputorum]|uniref:Uncharacterized protein n=1 Tax=Nocardia sputorum TaxID=2984338 RepID=A0ABM8CQY5_9NOCA|nr:hypothetical protein [Nocardia sputorum]BDT97324.1 hypothetical protein IFM12276_03530 [Nocardia sputorum]
MAALTGRSHVGSAADSVGSTCGSGLSGLATAHPRVVAASTAPPVIGMTPRALLSDR